MALRSSFTGKPFGVDSYAAVILLPILGMIFSDPWWKGLLIVPVILLVLLPFVLLFRQERAARADGRAAIGWVAAQYLMTIVMLVGLFFLTMHVHGVIDLTKGLWVLRQ